MYSSSKVPRATVKVRVSLYSSASCDITSFALSHLAHDMPSLSKHVAETSESAAVAINQSCNRQNKEKTLNDLKDHHQKLG